MLETLTVDVIVEQTPFFCPLVLLLCKQVNYIVNTDKFEYLLDSMCEDWNHERSYKEIGIMKKYGQRGNLLSRFYVVNAYICSFLFIQVPWSTRLVNSYKTQNITPSLQFVIPGYYFVDEVEYYYYIILHGTCTILIVVVVYCACDTSYMVLVQHTCGLFAVAGYRFKNSIREDNSVKGKYFDHWTKEAYKNACFSIQGHQRAINFVKEIERGHDTYLFTCLGLVILCFSITLIKLSTSDFDIDFYRYCSFTLCQLMHLFVIMLQGQFVLDSCERIHEAIYESLWYTSSSKTQALYVVALRRNLTPTCLTAGGLVQLNMQSFAEVVKMSVSYYTVLKTT
ncbi:PREDICTED: odorant receptor 22a-like [Habropoda laboriosa]|uniref:odorant receptor 22a-like n=1 Tax=Habropoda laboriosa TaxID=597456 RepID=UPI00083CDF13|nr:PREDICTED: odorant receptor 22a-like [Habropoda laboriosa]